MKIDVVLEDSHQYGFYDSFCDEKKRKLGNIVQEEDLVINVRYLF